jgi:hypothetical protein
MQFPTISRSAGLLALLVSVFRAGGADPLLAQAATRRCNVLLARASAAPDSVIRSSDIATCGSSSPTIIARLITSAPMRGGIYQHDLMQLPTMPSQAIVDAATALAQDARASVRARLAGFALLTRQVFGAHAGIAVPSGDPDRIRTANDCVAVTGSVQPAAVPGSEVRLRTLAESIIENPSAPPADRAIAGCVRRGIRPRYERRVDVTKISVERVCNTLFRISNHADTAAFVGWLNQSTSDSGRIEVPAGHQVIISSHRQGQIRFTQVGREITSMPTNSEVCKR